MSGRIGRVGREVRAACSEAKSSAAAGPLVRAYVAVAGGMADLVDRAVADGDVSGGLKAGAQLVSVLDRLEQLRGAGDDNGGPPEGSGGEDGDLGDRLAELAASGPSLGDESDSVA